MGQNGCFAVSKSTTALLSGTFYRTELSFFIPKLWIDEIYGVSLEYRDLTIRNITLIFSIENSKKEYLEESTNARKLKLGRCNHMGAFKKSGAGIFENLIFRPKMAARVVNFIDFC